MTYKGAIDEVRGLSKDSLMPAIFKPSLNKIAETLEMETKTCEDAVSRKEVMEAIEEVGLLTCEYVDVKQVIESLPSVQPIRPTSQKIKEYDGIWTSYRCKCGQYVQEWFKFCPNCGADMRGE